MLHTTNPAFVYPAQSASLKDLSQALAKNHILCRSTAYEGYIIIQPARPIPRVPLYQPPSSIPGLALYQPKWKGTAPSLLPTVV